MNRALRVVLLEDEDDIRDYLRKLLIRLGHDVVFAARSCAEFLEAWQRERPDLLLVDVALPDGDGRKAAAQVCRGRPMLVITLSAFGPRGAAEPPAQVALVKPARGEDVRMAIDIALRQSPCRDRRQPTDGS